MMKVNLELELTIEKIPCYVNFFVIFEKESGHWEYDWAVNKITSRNHSINFELMDKRYKSAIENAIEERLYRFNFEDFKREL